MELSKAISLVAVVLIVVLTAGYAAGDGNSAEAAAEQAVASVK